MNKEQRQRQKRIQNEKEKEERKKKKEKDQTILEAIKTFFLFFGILFLSMLLAYFGTKYEIPLFPLSAKHTSFPLVLPVGACIATHYFRKTYTLIASFVHFWLVKLWFWVGIITLYVISVTFSAVYLLEIIDYLWDLGLPIPR